MRIPDRPGLIAFALTTSILVPAGLCLLEAGPAEVARLVRPGQSTVAVGGASVKVTADRGIIDAGGTIHVKLTATADHARPVRVAVLVEEARGSNGGRVPDPPETIASDTIDLQAAPGGGTTRELAYKLRGFQGTTMGGPEPYGNYTVLVMPPATATAFEHKRRGAAAGRDNDFWTEYGNLADAGQAARVDVATRRIDPDLRLELPASVQVGQPFTVAVVMPNRKNGPKHVVLELDTPSLGADYIGIDNESITIDGDPAKETPAGKRERRAEFTVTVTTPGLLGLEATLRDTESGESLSRSLDAIDVQPAVPALAQASLQR